MRDPTADDTGDRATFVLRLSRQQRDSTWHGQVEHVESGERRPARSLADLPGLLVSWLRGLTRDRAERSTAKAEE